jgi:hypothetical protein
MIPRHYQCEASSIVGFIQQLAVSYIANGYFFYVTGVVPEAKDPRCIDAKLIERYGIAISKWSRARQKRAGLASIQYLRCGRLFVLLATHGEHAFFSGEGSSIRDVRRVPLKAFGYAIGHRRGRVDVRMEREEFKRLRAYFVDLAVHRSADTIAGELSSLRFEPYSGVRRQLLQLLRAVNRPRKRAGYELVPPDVLRLRRRIVRPFVGMDHVVLPGPRDTGTASAAESDHGLHRP